MATFGNLHNDHQNSDIFSNDTPQPNKTTTSDLTKKYRAEPGVIPGQRPAPWLGRHIFGVLAISSALMLAIMLVYTFTGGN